MAKKQGKRTVALLVAVCIAETWHPAGSVLELPEAEAKALVASGDADDAEGAVAHCCDAGARVVDPYGGASTTAGEVDGKPGGSAADLETAA